MSIRTLARALLPVVVASTILLPLPPLQAQQPGWTPDRSQRMGLEMDLTQGIVYRTTDGGRNWVEIWRGDNLARYLWIDPRDPDVLYVSTGIFDREAANTSVENDLAGGVGILKSTDGGRTWRVLNEGLTHSDVSVLALSDDGTVLYAGIEGDGVYRLGVPPAGWALAGTGSRAGPAAAGRRHRSPSRYGPARAHGRAVRQAIRPGSAACAPHRPRTVARRGTDGRPAGGLGVALVAQEVMA